MGEAVKHIRSQAERCKRVEIVLGLRQQDCGLMTLKDSPKCSLTLLLGFSSMNLTTGLGC